jgi:hypothetical protein
MAFGHIDPARLEGDALTRWYLRSPADIEEEKRQRAEQAYNAFFGQSGETPSDPPPSGDGGNATSADLTPRTWTQVGPNRWRSAADVVDRQAAGQEDSSYDASTAPLPTFQFAANPARRECVEQCSHLLERPQPPGSDRNQWDFPPMREPMYVGAAARAANAAVSQAGGSSEADTVVDVHTSTHSPRAGHRLEDLRLGSNACRSRREF